MPAPKQEAIQQTLSALQSGTPLLQKAFFTLARGFTLQASQEQFLLQVKGFNPKLADTLLIFRDELNATAQDEPSQDGIIDQAFLHYIVNTDGQLPDSDEPFDVLKAVTRYAEPFHVRISQPEEGPPLLIADEHQEPLANLPALPPEEAARALREIGPVVNHMRYGRGDIIPSFPFGFDEIADNYSLQNALALADFSHLAYFSPSFVEEQLRQWGYNTCRWIEDKGTDTQAFVTGKDGALIVSFRGTSSGKDVLMDTRFRKTKAFGGRGRVHRGFRIAIDSVWSQLKKTVKELGRDKPLFLCGHSLGAALAQLAAYRLAYSSHRIAGVYVYGSPRIGNPKFRDVYNKKLEEQTFLHINNRDIVARVPPRILGFRHLGGGPRLFDDGHTLRLEPKPKGLLGEEEVEKEFEELSEAEQQKIIEELREAQRSIKAATEFMEKHPPLPGAPNSKGLFDIKPVDDHSMDGYLYKFGRAVVDEQWERIAPSEQEPKSLFGADPL